MFALNSSLLLLYKTLHQQGRLCRVWVEKVSRDKIPASLLSCNKPINSSSSQETGATAGLQSISACVTAREQTLHSQGRESEESDNFYDESDFEEESDFEDFECVVCKLVFSGELRFDHHRKISHHWGCSYCHLVFHSSDLLHRHKEEANHWTDEDFEEQTDTEEDEEPVNWEELERLL